MAIRAAWVHPQPDLACVCLDDPDCLPAAAVECDRSADRLLPDAASGVEGGRVATGWVQDPVGDPGFASAPEGLGSGDPIWASECGREQGLGAGDDQVFPWACTGCGWRAMTNFMRFLLVGLTGLVVNSCGLVCLHGTGGHPLCDFGGDCDPGVDLVELWVDGDLGVWQARDGATVPAAAGEFPADQQPVIDPARTDHHLDGGQAGRALPDLEPGLAVCDDAAALFIGGQMDLES